jgi:hypothetical protein
LRRRFTTENKKTQGESERPASIDGIPWVCATTIATTTRSRKKRRFSFSSSLFYWYRLRECGTAHGQPSPPPPKKKRNPIPKKKSNALLYNHAYPIHASFTTTKLLCLFLVLCPQSAALRSHTHAPHNSTVRCGSLLLPPPYLP